MKVTGVHIEDFHQFKNLDIDLTYPKGHEKEGEPLEKVCIIGQSSTGKTKLLEIIGGLTYNHRSFREKYSFHNKNGYVFIKGIDIAYSQSLGPHEYAQMYNQNQNGFVIDNRSFQEKMAVNAVSAIPNLILYPAELNYVVSHDLVIDDFNRKEIIDFSIESASLIWNIILQNVQKYQEEEFKIRQQISRVVEDNRNDLKAITNALKVLEEWQKTSFNPIEDIAEKCLNPILEKFHLRVKTKLDIQKKDDIGFIKIEDFNGNEIPYGLWSTGTKQVVLSALPLYLLKPNRTIILFDEPERSLYPDLQRVIIDYYLQLTTDCQLFFATHSPIIASSFEPWEIIELKFNKDGHVHQELYYDGERHVDNYTITPNYLTYDLMLRNVFDLKETYPAIRDEKITEVLMLRNQLEKLKKEKKLDTTAGKRLYDKYMKLAKKLSWEFELPQYEEA